MTKSWHLESDGREVTPSKLDRVAEKMHHMMKNPGATCVLCRDLMLRTDGKIVLFDNYNIAYVFPETEKVRVVFDG